jgi:hypothetical protein
MGRLIRSCARDLGSAWWREIWLSLAVPRCVWGDTRNKSYDNTVTARILLHHGSFIQTPSLSSNKTSQAVNLGNDVPSMNVESVARAVVLFRTISSVLD